MVADSVEFLRANDLRVFLDAEHFFDGYKANPEFTMRILRAAEEAGAETLVLCDTNGGTLPYEVERIVADVLGGFETQVGVHFHNDSGCAVANSLAAVGEGATHVQGCVNGYGERAGNTDLSAAIPDLSPEAAGGHHPARAAGAAHPGLPPHRRAGEHRPEPAAALRRRLGLRPQGGAPHLGHRPAVRRLRAHLARAGRQRHPVRGVRDGRPLDAGHEGRPSWDSSSIRRPWPRCSTPSSASSTRATTSRWPTDRWSCCSATRPAGSRPSSSWSPTGSSPTTVTASRPRPR